MAGLVFASLVTWTVWLAKNLELWKASRTGRAALAVLNEARSLAEANGRLGKNDEPVARLLRTAVHEVQMSPHPDPEALKERISWLLERVEASSSRRIGRGMGLLASIGATAPFVGLFGTVWGIYHALTAIGVAGQASIDKVAGPVGEALIMTAIGLAVAVPAVLGYNWLIRRNKAAMERVRGFGAELHAALSVLIGDLQDQRVAGVIVPDFDRIDAMPVRAFAACQQEIDRGGARTSAGVAKGLAIVPAFRMRLQFEPRNNLGCR
jgi:biopolymer transport protein ExbB